ncbi:MAG: hypothetical protein RBS80_21445 [Thermoguttaceae bacterium]|nr:hypothetical protein [Thermoguttaceae bacterium]
MRTMNGRLSWFMTLGVLLCAVCPVTVHSSEPAAQAAGPLRIGWAMANLTPDVPVHMAGLGHLRVSEGVMDPVTATVLVLESVGEEEDGDMLIMVGIDLARAEKVLCDRVRELVAGLQPEIDVAKIVLNATHNHGAPCVRTAPELAAKLAERGVEVPAEWSYYGIDPDAMSPVGYLAFAAPRIAEAIAEAWENRKPGGVSFGLGHAVVSHNRQVTYRDGRSQQYGSLDRPDFSHIEGYEDHSVGLLYTFDADGELTGVVVNVPCSALGFGRSVTADFWHDTRNEMRKRFGESIYTLQQVASSGEQWPRVVVERRAHQRMLRLAGRSSREEIAKRLGDAVASLLPYMKENIEWDPVFAHRVEQVELTQLRVTKEMAESRRQQFEPLFAQYRKMREEIDANPEIREKPRWFEKISGVYWQMDRADRVVRMFERQQAGEKLPVTLHVVRIGDMAIATHPVALYLDFGMQIKARSKAVQTFTVQTADGHYRYLPTERSLAGSAYGAVPESITFGPEGGRELVEETLKLIESLWEE